ncbi:HAD-like domain-containing protein [Suillus ampliporus]|nr:HAD-like domain-containing protein [Suillus ampliporus]
MTIRLVTFDALHTLITPRLPIYVQYSQTFAPYLGDLEPGLLRQSFKVGGSLALTFHNSLTSVPSALKQVQKDKPAYQGDSGAEGWWSEVIKRTAIGAGANPQGSSTQSIRGTLNNNLLIAVDSSLPQIVPNLMERFSSREGYKLFDDSLPVLRQLRNMNICTALISNTDTRTRSVLKDLDIAQYLDPILLSEEAGIEKPDAKIFRLAFSTQSVPMELQEGVHVGDELESDYHGARAAGMHALLLRRPGSKGDGEHKKEGENLRGVQVVNDLWGVLKWVE